MTKQNKTQLTKHFLAATFSYKIFRGKELTMLKCPLPKNRTCGAVKV